MKTTLARLAAGLVLLGTLAACSDDDPNYRIGPVNTVTVPATLKEFAQTDIGERTTGTASPQELNTLVLDTSSEDPADFDDLLQSP